MVSQLTPHKISELATSLGARSIAVENFLGSIDNTMPMHFHLMNLSADAKSYKWNVATTHAIELGIRLAYKGNGG